jgi:acyl carrier protein
MRDGVMEKVCAALRSVLDDERAEVRPEHRLVDDLGFDSVNVASLTIALEEQFDDVLLLSDWIAAANSPSDLTVASLADYVRGVLDEAG